MTRTTRFFNLNVFNVILTHLDLRQLTIRCFLGLSGPLSVIFEVNLTENGQFFGGRLKVVHKCGLVFGVGEEGLENVQVGRVVVPVELPVVAMLVSEHTAATVHALLCVVEGPAVLGLELLVVLAHGSVGELLLAVSKAALGLVAAHSCLNPVLAEFGLVFAVCVVFLELRHHLAAHGEAVGLDVVPVEATLAGLTVVGLGLGWSNVGLHLVDLESGTLGHKDGHGELGVWAEGGYSDVERIHCGGHGAQEGGNVGLR